MYFIPVSAAVRAHTSASNRSGLNSSASLAYSRAGIRSPAITCVPRPKREYNPQWMNMPSRASLNHSMCWYRSVLSFMADLPFLTLPQTSDRVTALSKDCQA